MANVSSLLTIEVDELGRPLNIKATDENDLLASSILPDNVKVAVSGFEASATTVWNAVYNVVNVNKSIWDAGGEASVPSDVSSRWENSYNYLNSGGSSTLEGVSSTVYINSGTWGVGGGAIPNDVSSKWQNAYDYLNGGASANIGSTSTTVLNSSGNWTTSYTAVNTSGNTVWNRVFNAVSSTSGTWNNAYNYLNGGASASITSVSGSVLTGSGGWQNAFGYTNAASANIGSTSTTVLNGSSNWTNSYNYLNGGASANIGSTSTTVLNSSGNWTTAYTAVNTSGNTVWNRVFNAVSSTSGTWNNAYNYLNGGASANIASVSASVFNTSSNWNSVYNRTLGSSGGWQNAFNYTSNASANIASVSASVFNTSSNWNTAYTHSQIIDANPHATDISSLAGVSLDIPSLQPGHFLKYKPGLGWTNDSIAITNVATGGFGTITNTSALTFSANQGLSVTAVGTTLTFAISGNVSGATSSTNTLSATSALNAQQAPNGFNVTGTLAATTASATTYLNLPSSTLVWQQAEDIVLYVKNKNATSLPKGKAVTIVSGAGDTPIVEPLSSVNYHVPEAQGFANHVIGLVQDTIAGDSFGYLVVEGIIVGTGGDPLDTSLWNVGDGLYVSSNGQLNNIRPPAPYESHPVGFVIRKHATVGSILVKIENAAEINDIVGFNLASSLGNGDLISYDLTTSTFKNVQSVAVSGQGKFGSVSATTYLNLPSSTIVWASATSATNAFSATNALSSTSAFSATNAFSSTNALSATSALNASRAPAGFTVTGTLLATNISATNFSGIDHLTHILNAGNFTHNDIDNHIGDTANPHQVTAEQVGNFTAQWNASAIQDIEIKVSSPNNREVLMYASASNWWAPNVLTANDVGNTTAQWNASAIRSSPLSATLVPTTGQSLVYNGSVWTASTVVATGGGGGGGGGIADASSLRGSPLSATLVPTAGQALMYNGSVWTASAALFAYTYGSGAPTGGSDGDIYLQTDVEALQVATVSATTYLNLPSSVITWTNATSATNAFSSTYAFSATNAFSSTYAFSATNALSSTNAFSSTYALSATSALNAQQAPNGFTVTGTATATTASSTNLLTLSGDVSSTRLTDYSERIVTFTITTSAITLDLNTAQVFSGTLNSNISSVTISNPDPRSNTAQGFTMLLMADGTARTITWPAAVKWPAGTGPTLTSTNGKVDILSFFSPNNGTTWYGFIGGQNF